jgi:class 3 adenylate cyclase
LPSLQGWITTDLGRAVKPIAGGRSVVAASESATTILFTDIEDSSVLVEALGDRRWLDLLRLHNALVREQIERHRGFEVKTVGDGFMVAFSSAPAAVACAAGIQQALTAFNATSDAPPLHVRIGLHTGTALREDDDFFGREVVMAARVSAAARGGEVLVSDAVRDALDDGAPLGEPQARALKGLQGRHRLYPLLWDPGAAPVERRLHDSARLHERLAELEVLAHALTAASAGTGLTIAVAGPAGLGKSALLDTITERARDSGVRVLRAQGFEIEQAFPFGVARELIGAAAQRLTPETQRELGSSAALRALGIGDAEQPSATEPAFELWAGLQRVLLCLTEGAPTLLVVDDAQWVDDASLEWLGYASRRLAGHPILLVLGVRDDGEPLPGPLAELLESKAVTRLEPRPLSAAAGERIVLEREPSADEEFVAACHAITAGVPMYLHELLTAARTAGIPPTRAGAGRLTGVSPSSVEQLVLRRLESLGADELALARACATLDTRADLRSAGRVAGLAPPQALAAADALVTARLLEPRRPLQFVHPIMRAAVAAGMPAAERSALHATAARLLIEDAAPAQEVAAHLLMVAPGDMDDIVSRLQAAAASAVVEGAPGAAARFLERALDEGPPAETLSTILVALAHARLRAAEPAAAVPLADQAFVRATGAAGRGAALAVLAQAVEAEVLNPDSPLDWEPDGRRITDLIGVTAAELGEEHRALRFELEAQSLSLASTRASMLAVPISADTVARMRRLGAEATGDTAGERELRGLLAGYQTITGSAHVDAVLDLARRGIGADWSGMEPDDWFAPLEVLMAGDAHAEAEQHLAAAARRARRLGSPTAGAYAGIYRAWNAWLAGALDDAIAFHSEGTALLAERGGDEYLEAVGGGLMCAALLIRGDAGGAQAFAASNPHAAMRNATLGLVQLAGGDLDGGIERLQEAQDRLARRGIWRTTGPLRAVRPTLAVALADNGDIDEARAVADAEEEVARRFGSASCVAEALRAQAAALGEAGPLREAAQIIRGSEARLVEAEVLVSLGRMAGGEEAERALTRGLGIAERRGAEAIAERARSALAAL